MSCKYSIIQYFPNPINGERINIGIVVIDDNDTIKLTFLTNWNRVKAFAIDSNDITYLFGCVAKFEKLAAQNVFYVRDDRTNLQRLLFVINNWHYLIQFTDLRGSLDSIDALLLALVKEFLVN